MLKLLLLLLASDSLTLSSKAFARVGADLQPYGKIPILFVRAREIVIKCPCGAVLHPDSKNRRRRRPSEFSSQTFVQT